jgi:gamma-glutamylcysteine synthetase
MTTVFPEVRLKKYIEMRGADGGPKEMICALPALWTGLLYDAGVQAKCLELTSSWTLQDIEYLRKEVRPACWIQSESDTVWMFQNCFSIVCAACFSSVRSCLC